MNTIYLLKLLAMKIFKTFMAISCLSIIASCSEGDTNLETNSIETMCGKNDPFSQLEWISDFIESCDGNPCTLYNGAQMYFYRYNESDVLYLTNGASSNSSCTDFLFDCSGNKLDIEIIRSDFEKNRTNKKLLWTNGS